MESRVASSCWFACSSLAVNWLLIVPILPCVSHSSPLIITQSSPNVPTRHSILHLYFDATVTLHTELLCVYFTSTVCPLTHSLTHCCAWPAEGRSVLHIERSWPAIQAAPTDRPMSSSNCCSQFKSMFARCGGLPRNTWSPWGVSFCTRSTEIASSQN